jgi:hypothetical protein
LITLPMPSVSLSQKAREEKLQLMYQFLNNRFTVAAGRAIKEVDSCQANQKNGRINEGIEAESFTWSSVKSQKLTHLYPIAFHFFGLNL